MCYNQENKEDTMFPDDTKRTNDKIYYGFLAFFTVVVGVMAFLINQG